VPEPPPGLAAPPIRLAILASSTVDLCCRPFAPWHAPRLWIETHTPDYGQYAGVDGSGVATARVGPTAVLSRSTRIICSADRPGGTASDVERHLAQIADDWRRNGHARVGRFVARHSADSAAGSSRCSGSNEHRLPGSQFWAVSTTQHYVAAARRAEGVDLLALDSPRGRWLPRGMTRRCGIAPSRKFTIRRAILWRLVARLLAAAMAGRRRRSCSTRQHAVGGVIGDDGLEASNSVRQRTGEASRVSTLRRAIEPARHFLAVCSKT